jgi:DNA-directed RNA polymerase subunit beta
MPWEGYNSEDAVLISERLVYEDIYTSFHIRKYEIQTHVTSQGPERVTNEIPHLEAHLLRNLDKNGIVMLGSWVETGDILVGKLTPQIVKESSYAPEDRLLRAILGIQVSTSKETCLKLPIGGRGRVIDVRWIQKRGGSSYNPEMIRVYISQKREIKVGDKVAGRHGNKGIISKILPRQDMPYLQDGKPVDMVFNPLGVPSRMNVGQIFECSLGLAGGLLDRHYRIAPFDERYEQEASRKLVFSELYEASKQTANPSLFLGYLYRQLDSSARSVGRYDINSYVHVPFLQMFFFEGDSSLAPKPIALVARGGTEKKTRSDRWHRGTTSERLSSAMDLEGSFF